MPRSSSRPQYYSSTLGVPVAIVVVAVIVAVLRALLLLLDVLVLGARLGELVKGGASQRRECFRAVRWVVGGHLPPAPSWGRDYYSQPTLVSNRHFGA